MNTNNSKEQQKQRRENKNKRVTADPASNNYDKKTDGPNRPSV